MKNGTFDTIMRKTGVAVVTGALVLTTTGAPAVAAAATATTGSLTQTASDDTPPDPGPGMGGGYEGEMGEPPDGDMGGGMGGGGMGGGADTMTFDYTGSYTGVVTADGESVTSSGEDVEATESDQNALLAENGGTLTVTDDTVSKSGDDTNGDNCNFYGLNSIVLAVGEGSQVNVSDTTLSAESEGSNAIFATDSGTVYANDVTIETSAGNSRGLDATYGGTVIANDLTIETSGDHCAATATDRGGGYISVTDSTFTTNGSGSPLIYSTGDIEVSDVTGTATGSQIAGMEGLNTILINDSTLESTITGATASDPVADAVIIYQSTSGDAESTTGDAATFQVVDSTLTSAIESGSFFYLTNTSANVVLQDTTLDYDSSAADLLYVAGNDANNWGSAGSNGATVTFTGIDQILEGDVVVDTISSADLYLTEGSNWTGAASIEENANGSTSEAPISVNVDATSAWVVTDDSTVSNLTVAEGGQVVDPGGNTVSIVAGGETVVEGTSSVTVTVEGSYSTSYDASGAGTLATDLIDRSGFDETYGTSTAFSLGDADTADAADASAEGTTTEEPAETETTSEGSGNPVLDFFAAIFSTIGGWFASLFG